MKISKENFGKAASGKAIEKFIIGAPNGIKLGLITYGASIQELWVPDKNGKLDDIVLGFDDFASYEKHQYFSGAIIGRYANRINKGTFILDDRAYELAKNLGKHHLHGGTVGFGKKVWEASPFEGTEAAGVTFSYFSSDGEEAYPGNLTVQVTYTLLSSGTLTIDYYASSDSTTHVNLTNHAYFNLKGAGEGDVLEHRLMMNAPYFTPVTEEVVPTGEIISVKGTPFDFTRAKPIGQDIDQTDEQLKRGGGYDHNFVLNMPMGNGQLGLVAQVNEPKTGRTLEILGTQPGVQLYTANFLDADPVGKGGKVYQQRGAFCLETQHFPDSPNMSHFPSTVVLPEKPYNQTAVFKFGISND